MGEKEIRPLFDITSAEVNIVGKSGNFKLVITIVP